MIRWLITPGWARIPPYDWIAVLGFFPLFNAIYTDIHVVPYMWIIWGYAYKAREQTDELFP